MMKKRTVAAAFALLLAMGGSPVQAQEPQRFQIVAEGQEVLFYEEPFLYEGRVFVPLRHLSAGLGIVLQYEPLEDVVTLEKGDVRLVLNLRSGDATRNGEPYPMKPGPRIVEDRVMVPVRFVGEAFGEQVSYDPKTRRVTLAPSPEVLAERAEIRGIWMDALTKMSGQSSYRMNMQGRAVQNYQLEERHSSWAYQREPFVLYGKQDEPPYNQSYILPAESWSYLTEEDRWEQDDFGPELERANLQFAGLFQLTESEVDLLLPFASLKEADTSYVLTVRPSLYSYMKWMMSTSHSPEEVAGLSSASLIKSSGGFETARLEYAIDKNTGLLKESKSWLLRTGLDADTSVRFSDYGQVPPIATPHFPNE